MREIVSAQKPVIRLYHYIPACWALDNIRRHRLKLSTLEDLNDPYEWGSVFSTDPTSQSALKEAKCGDSFADGFQSFSSKPDEILMWSHYSDKHKGACLGFDIPADIPMPIKYVPTVHEIGALGELSRNQQGTLHNNLRWTKSDIWRYENELRVWGKKDEEDARGRKFVKFGKQLALKEVIAGARCTVTKDEFETPLHGYSDVVIKKARANHNKFELIIDDWRFDEPDI